jgi:hypothetical protein
MNRRDFLTRFGIGVGAALVLAKLPESAITGLTTGQAAQRCAMEFMRHRWNAITKGKSSKEIPRAFVIGQELYDAFQSELTPCERFIPEDIGPRFGPPVLVFKSSYIVAKGHGWYMEPAPDDILQRIQLVKGRYSTI